MDSGYDAGGSTDLEARIQVLRAQLSSGRDACHNIVDRLERDRKSGLSGHVETDPAIQQYQATAQNLLYLVPDDDAANAALLDVENLRRHIAGPA